jgi:hypothetical protein
MSAMPRWHSISLAVLAAPLASCDAHVQASGTYAFTASEIVRDDCGVLASSPTLGTGILTVNGEVVALTYEPYAIHLRGFFKEVSESFYLDGAAASISSTVGAEQCLFDLVTMHVDGTSASATAFTGTMQIRYDAASAAQCQCDLSVVFRAERTGDAAASASG